MLDENGYRPNVGIILINGQRQVFWGKRVREHAWQFPQGGIKSGERPSRRCSVNSKKRPAQAPSRRNHRPDPRLAALRCARALVRREWRGHYRGQKQIWFLLKMLGRDCDVSLRNNLEKPEFDAWRWHDYWIPLESVIEFKRDVYRSALAELSGLIFSQEELQLRPESSEATSLGRAQ